VLYDRGECRSGCEFLGSAGQGESASCLRANNWPANLGGMLRRKGKRKARQGRCGLGCVEALSGTIERTELIVSAGQDGRRWRNCIGEKRKKGGGKST